MSCSPALRLPSPVDMSRDAAACRAGDPTQPAWLDDLRRDIEQVFDRNPDRNNPPGRGSAQRIEIVTVGIDEATQGIGADPYGSHQAIGLRIPTLPTASNTGGAPSDVFTGQASFQAALVNRYLFNLCQFVVGPGQTAHIIGWRQLLTIGLKQGSAGSFRPIETQVGAPFFRFVDGNVSWHLMDTGNPAEIPMPSVPGASDVANFQFQMSDNPALLYQTATLAANDPFYVDLTAYTAPNGGRPYGRTLCPGFNPIYDIRRNWNLDDGGYKSLDIWVTGPRQVNLFGSVRQTNPSGRTAVTPPGTVVPLGIPPEEAFLLNFPTAIYWRIGASLIVDFSPSLR